MTVSPLRNRHHRQRLVRTQDPGGCDSQFREHVRVRCDSIQIVGTDHGGGAHLPDQEGVDGSGAKRRAYPGEPLGRQALASVDLS